MDCAVWCVSHLSAYVGRLQWAGVLQPFALMLAVFVGCSLLPEAGPDSPWLTTAPVLSQRLWCLLMGNNTEML